MKNSLLIFLIAIVQVSASVTIHGQNLTLMAEGKTVREVFKQIENETNYRFFYNEEFSDLSKPLSFEMRDYHISEVLDVMLANSNVTYRILENNVVVITPHLTESQETTVTGRVTDETTGQPIPGATVMVKGTSTGTVTDVDGTYLLTNIPDDATLVFSFVGMQSKEVVVGSQTNINITLEAEAVGLDEVVVIGYGTQRRINLTGSVGMVDEKQFANRPVTNITQSLQGQVSGLTINQVGGQPGGEQFRINIRGVSTFSSNPPLIIVDGITMSLDNLNPHDIQSVSVLKDAASAAIYGARASGGVILITTKRGAVGAPRVSYDSYFGIQSPTGLPEQVNAYEHVMLFREAQYNDDPGRTVYKYTLEDLEGYRTGTKPEFDRVGYLFNDAFQHNHNLSITGGTEVNQYSLSLGYTSQDGVLRNTSANRYNFRLNNNLVVSDRLNINLNAQYAPLRRHQMSEATYPGGPTRNLTDIVYHAAFRRGADDIIFTEDGQWASVTGWANRIGLASPDGGFQNRDVNRYSAVVNLDYKILPNLSLNAMYGGKYDDVKQIDYSKRMQFINPNDLVTVDFDYNTNSMLDYNQQNYHHNVQLLLNYDKNINDVHDIRGLLGISQEWNNDRWSRAGRRNFVTDDIYVINAGSSDPTVWTTQGSASEWALRSYFGRLNYMLLDKYLFETTLRYDGSSRFASDNRWGLFPSFSAGWIISEESFIRDNIQWLDALKIRGSWGQVGNQNISLYQYYSTVSTSAYYFGGNAQTATYYSGTANPFLEWETKTVANLGIDLGMADNRLYFEFDVFKETTDGILMRPAVPTTFGMGAPFQNVATVENVGWETQVSYRDRISNLSYRVSFQISDAANTIVDMIGSPQIRGYNRGTVITETGYEIDEWFGYKAIGIFSSQEEVDNYAKLNPRTGIGDLKIEDVNGDGQITADDRQRLGSTRPRYPYGFHLDLGWRNLDFSMFLQGVGYRRTYLANASATPFAGSLETAQKRHLDRWHLAEDGETWIPGEFPKMRIGSGFNNVFSSFWLQNAAYLRMKNIQLGYSLPPSLLERMRIERFRIYVSGENLFTLTEFYGFDPEAPDGRFSAFPLSRVINFGVNVSF